MPRIVGAEAKKRTGNTAAPAEVEAIVPVSLKGRTKPPGQVNRLVGGLYGPPKSGKTTAAASGHNTLLVEFDPDGDATETLQGRTDIDVYKPANWSEVDSMTKDLLTVDRETWDFIVLDSVTFWAEILGGKELATQLKAGKDARTTYQRIGASINQTFRDLLTSPASLIFTAQIKADVPDDDDSDITVVGPDEGTYPVTLALTPMVFKVLTPAVSFLGRTYRRSDGFYVSLNDGGRTPASNRLGLQSPQKNLNLQDMLNELKERNNQ
jgi:AAA domain-containing protein